MKAKCKKCNHIFQVQITGRNSRGDIIFTPDTCPECGNKNIEILE